ncbi:MAG: hypothetical protein ACOC38_05285 [Promethearchaeia archaeon]
MSVSFGNDFGILGLPERIMRILIGLHETTADDAMILTYEEKQKLKNRGFQ